MDNAERRMTTGRQIVEPLEDENYVNINGFVIPKGNTLLEKKHREQVIFEMYRIWCEENPSKKRRNIHLKSEIEVTADSIQETKLHSANNYKSALAFYYLDFILKNAKQVKKDTPQSNRQHKLVKGGYMLEMKLDNFDFPYFKEVKLMVGVRRNTDKIMYSITAIKVNE